MCKQWIGIRSGVSVKSRCLLRCSTEVMLSLLVYQYCYSFPGGEAHITHVHVQWTSIPNTVLLQMLHFRSSLLQSAHRVQEGRCPHSKPCTQHSLPVTNPHPHSFENTEGKPVLFLRVSCALTLNR